VTLYGVDVHPEFQRGISIEQIAAEGFEFLSVKLSEGTSSKWETIGSADWIKRGKDAGMACLGYHYAQPGDIPNQAKVFAASLARCGVPGVIDAEAVTTRAGFNVPTLTISMIRELHNRLLGLGAVIPFIYLPRWWWQLIGSPDLTGLPLLWSSSYPSSRQAPASVLYEAVTPDRWSTYGNGTVAVLQFAETGLVAGRAVDVNAFPGTRAQFDNLISGPRPLSATTTRRNPVCYRLDPTPIPTGATPDTVPDGTWDAVEDTITSPGPAGGWPGRVVFHLTFGYRGGFIQEVWSGPSGKHYVARWDPAAKTGGKYVEAVVTQNWELPAGDTALVVRYATRTRGSVTPETQN
jgi:hypothetical protein